MSLQIGLLSRLLLATALLVVNIGYCSGDTMEIYNSKMATSDLGWTKRTNGDIGWEEVSSYDSNKDSVVRSYQICNIEEEENNNWIRSPYIEARGGRQIHLDLEFSINRCTHDNTDNVNAKCKETFNIFYYEASSNIASSTFPPWHETPYTKIDTIAANAVNGVNKKTFKFGPLSRAGIYLAVQDQGACMSLIAVRVYYYYCPTVTKNLAVFPRTISANGVASLVTIQGGCVVNSKPQKAGEPLYHCSSNGQWQIITGECVCETGYQHNFLNTECRECPAGTYKSVTGQEKCEKCPQNSGIPETPTSPSTAVGKLSIPHNECPCHPGYARAPGEDISVSCTSPPSSPLKLEVVKSNATYAQLKWLPPSQDGGRDDLYYSFTCSYMSVADKTNSRWLDCTNSISFFPRLTPDKFYSTKVTVKRLAPYTMYKFQVHTRNGASASLQHEFTSSAFAEIELTTNQSVPSAPTSVRVIERSVMGITIAWQVPNNAHGIITGYEVELQKRNSGSSQRLPVAPIVEETIARKLSLSKLMPGTDYQVRIRAKTSAGLGPYSRASTFTTASMPEPVHDDNIIMIVGILAGVVVVLALAVVCIYKKTGKLFCLNTSRTSKKQKKQSAPTANGNSHNEHAMQERLIGQRIYVDYPDPKTAIAKFGQEIDAAKIKVEEVIGKGEFAEVVRGTLTEGKQQTSVAIKRLKSGASERDHINFLREAMTIAQFSDPNIVKLKGVVTKQRPFMIVTEFMENSSLDTFLQARQGQLNIIELVTLLRGISSGMRYLSQMKYVHRDLAARNILVGSDLACKVSDFGLSRTLENDPHATYTTQGGKIAIRWTAPECIRYRQFTSASDVWSFGIVMWEVMSYGEKPYWDMSNPEIVDNVENGMRLPSPMGCPKVLHSTMLGCWQKDPNIRPTFDELVHRFDSLLRQPEPLRNDLSTGDTIPLRSTAAKNMATPNLSRAINNGEVVTVEQWLEIQRLSNYSDQFRNRGIDSLDKVSELTINDLKIMGIDVTLHMNKLENGIRTLKRHLSTCTSTPSSSARTSNSSSVIIEEDEPLFSRSVNV